MAQHTKSATATNATSPDLEKLRAAARKFIETTEATPPKRAQALPLFKKYVSVLHSFSDEDWRRFHSLTRNEIKPVELALNDPAIAQLNPPDHAFCLIQQIRSMDEEWWKRYWKTIVKWLAWVAGIPLVGTIAEWLKDNWTIIFGASVTPDLFQSEEYAFLSLLGFWSGLLYVLYRD
jgi:hypothetical protein